MVFLTSQICHSSKKCEIKHHIHISTKKLTTHYNYKLPLNTDDKNGIYRFGIEKACVTTRNYIPCAVVIFTTFTLLSVCSVTNSMQHSYHSPFHGSRSSNFDFLANVFNFFRN